MNRTNSIAIGAGWIDERASGFAKSIVRLVKSITLILGIVCLNLADIILGALALSLIITNDITMGSVIINSGYIALAISISTTAIQTTFWSQAIGLGSQASSAKKSKGTGVLLFVGALVLLGLLTMFLDTTIDVSVVNYLIDAQSPKLFLSSGMNWLPMKAFVTALLVILLGFNEPITVLILRKNMLEH